MAPLTISQIQAIKEHMTHDDSVLTKKFKAKYGHENEAYNSMKNV